jgi:hypothetical protein
MKGVIISIILINSSFLALSQKEIIVKGFITDEKEIPISNVNISIIGSSKGTKTNKRGFFYLTIQLKATTLKVSHIGYYTKNKILVEKIINDTINITIQLTEKTNQLATFDIHTEKIELLYSKNFVPIYDYQFYENNLLLIVKELNIIKLKLTNDNLKKLNELVIPPNTKNIYRDCFGNIHVLSKDSAYQLQINKKSMAIIYRVSIHEFNTHLRPCVTAFKQSVIFKQKVYNSQSTVYYSVDENKEVKYLRKIEDKVAESYDKQRKENIKQLQDPTISQMSEKKMSLYKYRTLMHNIGLLNILLNNLTESPLFATKNKVYIFDHTTDSCLVFNENLVFKKSFFTDYKLQKKWDKELIIDREQGDIYAKFKKNGLCYLKKIDLTTGKIIKSYKLEKHTFPSHIKIKNNTAYYLHKDHYNHGQMSLFKQLLY